MFIDDSLVLDFACLEIPTTTTSCCDKQLTNGSSMTLSLSPVFDHGRLVSIGHMYMHVLV